MGTARTNVTSLKFSKMFIGMSVIVFGSMRVIKTKSRYTKGLNIGPIGVLGP